MFTVINTGDQEAVQDYRNNTTKFHLERLKDNESYSAITDNIMTIKFSSPMQKRTVPSGWNNWSSSKIYPFINSEEDHPAILFAQNQAKMTWTFDNWLTVFGFEMEADNYNLFRFNVEFWASDTINVGNIQEDVRTPNGALLFAAKGAPFLKVIISVAEQNSGGFAVAQIRYQRYLIA